MKFFFSTLLILNLTWPIKLSSSFNTLPNLEIKSRSGADQNGLFGIKRGKLLSNIEESGLTENSEIPKKPEDRRKSAKNKTNRSGESTAAISSDLTKWAIESGVVAEVDTSGGKNPDEITQQSRPSARSSSKAIKSKNKKNVERRIKQAERQANDELLKKRIQKIVFQLEDLFEQEKNRDMTTIMGLVQELVEMPAPSDAVSVRTLFGSPKQKDFRLVWAGSDDAICHIGTGLHNVPLARLQEVFLTVGKGYAELQEVIRVLGPFPNVKNSLTGDVTVKGGGSSIQIIYDRMIDGTGKELSAGKTKDERTVSLDMLYASEYGIVCRVPSDGEVEQAFNEQSFDETKNSSLLMFLPEPDLNSALEVLRVA